MVQVKQKLPSDKERAKIYFQIKKKEGLPKVENI
jgi:hypothetical protein